MTSTEPRNPFTRPGFITAAIIVGIIVLAALIVLVTTLTRGSTSPSDPTPNTPSATAPGSNAEDKSVCGLTGFEATNTLTTAPETKWELVGTVAAPVDRAGAGPGVSEDDGFRSCYAHTAEGALFAAVSYIAVSSDTRNSARLYELLADGEVRDQLHASPAPGDPSSTRLQVAGFKVNSYSSNEATIDIAWKITSQGGSLVSFPTVLRWEHGDWKILITKDGPPFAPSPLPNLGGYIPWAGV